MLTWTSKKKKRELGEQTLWIARLPSLSAEPSSVIVVMIQVFRKKIRSVT